MSDIGSVLDTDTKYKHSYYDESEDTPKIYMAEDNYPAHIVKVETAERTVKSKYKALIYNCTVKLADACSTKMFNCRDATGKNVEAKGSDFVGREIRSIGVFQFLHPTGDDTFEANPGGNRRYLQFCEAIGKPAKVTSVTIDGEKRKVKELPNLSENDILGVPITAVIKNSKPWVSERDGKSRTSLEVKWFEPWVEGTPISVDDVPKEDLPF